MAVSDAERQRIIEAFNSIGELRGWDWSRLRSRRAKTPWNYPDVVRSHVKPTDRVLDVGTGGGEKFLLLADAFGSGVGVDSDPSMIEVANENLPEELSGRVQFMVGDADDLAFENESFDVVLNRHSIVNPDEVVRVLRPGGLFINQHVGPKNLEKLVDPWRHMGELGLGDVQGELDRFDELGCEVLEFREYDVEYVFLDEESLLFQLKAMPMPAPVVAERDADLIAGVLESTRGPDGAFHSNEHRFLRVITKSG